MGQAAQLYGVPTASVAHAPVLGKRDALLPFEQDQLKRLIAQLEGSAPRVRTAFIAHIRANRLK